MFSVASTVGLNGVIEIAIPWSFLVTNPLNAVPFTLNPGDTILIRGSQSFGYSMAGGVSYYGANRLGAFTYVVPAPGAATLIGLAGLVASRRRRN